MFPLAGEGSLPTVMVACAVISVVGAVLSEYYIDLDDDSADEYRALPNDGDIVEEGRKDRISLVR